MTIPLTRILAFGGSTVRVDYSGDRAARIVAFLFNRIGDGHADAAPLATLRLSEDDAGVLTLASGDDELCVDRVDAAIASWLLHVTCTRLAGARADGQLLHAAAVSWNGRGMLLPGVTGSGKSTLTAFLASRGFRYLTDELAYVPPATTLVGGFTSPIKIKKAGLDALIGHVPFAPGRFATMSAPGDTLVDPDGALCETGQVPLSVVVFPRYQPGGRFSLTPLSSARAGLRLMRVLLNAGWLADHGFRESARIASAAVCYELHYASLDDIAQHLESLRRLTMERPVGEAASIDVEERARVRTP